MSKYEFTHLSQEEILDKIVNDDFNTISVICRDSYTTSICEDIRHQISGVFWNKILAGLKDDKLQEKSLEDFKQKVREQLYQYIDDILFLKPSNTLIYFDSLSSIGDGSRKILLNRDVIKEIPSIVLFIHEQEELRVYQSQLFSLEKDREV